MENKKIYVAFKKSSNNCDEYCGYCESYETQILAVCNNPKKALEILENELKLCKMKRIDKKSCLLYVKVFNSFNQVNKKDNNIFNIFQFKKMIKTLL